jgi:glycosyltransferase involved in cell wall biosynthesis
LSDSLRILLVAPIRLYNAEAEYIHRLSRGLVARGHHPVVMGIPGSPLLKRVAHEGIETCGHFRMTSLNPGSLLKDMPGLLRYLETERFHLINVHRSEGFIIMAWAVRRLNCRPGLIRTRGDMRPVRRDPVNRKLYGQWCDHIIASNRLLEQELIIRLNLKPDKIQTIYMGIDPEEMKPKKAPEEVRRDLSLAPEERVIGFMGRIGLVKGHQYLLSAVPKILAEFQEARFLLIYPYVENDCPFLQQLSRSRWKDKFKLIGPRSNWADVMQLAEVAVIPSLRSEGNCRAALEWMALRKPVVGTRVGAIPELIEQADTGYLIQPRQAEALADAVINLLRHPARGRQMGEKGYERLKRYFTADEMVTKTLAAYQAVQNELAGL